MLNKYSDSDSDSYIEDNEGVFPYLVYYYGLLSISVSAALPGDILRFGVTVAKLSNAALIVP